jgi:hypothetical protein
MGRHRLRAGKPRLLGKHNTVRGRWYGEAWAALREEFGELTGLARLEAGRVAVAWVNWRVAAETLEAARRAREVGVGRRPSTAQLERLARRHGLADKSYRQAMDVLRTAAVRGQATPVSGLELLARGRG